MTLRWLKRGVCPVCERIDALARQEEKRKDPAFRLKQAEYVREKRKLHGRPSRSKYGLPYAPVPDEQTRAMRRAIASAGQLPSVAQLIRDQQREHWRNHPDDYLAFRRLRARLRSRWKFMTDPRFRLYHRAKSKARKLAQRGGTPSHLTPSHLWQHWCRFDHCCAYCGCSGDLEVEHVVPISKGGEHRLGNIVPACTRCNSSKRTRDAHSWYKTQPFYSKARWNKIQSVLAKSQPTTHQLSLMALIA